jgi:hypothetical protein
MQNSQDEITKITVKIYEPLLIAFDRQLKSLFIKRDEFLNHVIKVEIPLLAKEMNDLRQSGEARRYIAGKLKKMGTRTVNVVVEKATALALNEIVESANMVRDAFVNRLILLLAANEPLIAYLNLPDFLHEEAYQRLIPRPIRTSPLPAIASILEDPLYYLRLAAEERLESGLYRMELPDVYDGFSCYLPDENVPGTAEYIQPKDRWENFLEGLFRSRNDAAEIQSHANQESLK